VVFDSKKSSSSGIVFLVIIVVMALLVIFFARQENNPMGDDFNLTNNSDGNLFGDVFKPIDYNSPFSAPATNATKAEVYFCPQDACKDKLIDKVNSAQKSIYIAIYSFTLDDLASALISAKQRGVDVKVIFDYDQSTSSYSDDEKLIAAGIPIARRNGSGYMHNKFTIIDGNLIATGSFNYSQNADERNDENLVFIVSEEIASKFKADFDHLWDISIKAS
jgi:phosphatidylserine/phosphatidylglycerophosphate/cardiolipin synthase-like enzyme